MRTFVTDAGPQDLERLAGVKWRKPTPECLVRFGEFQGATMGIEACGKVWAVHVDGAKAEAALISFLADCTVWGAEVWTELTGQGVPHIGGAQVDELVDGAAAVFVDVAGKKTAIGKETAKVELAAALGVAVPKEVEP